MSARLFWIGAIALLGCGGAGSTDGEGGQGGSATVSSSKAVSSSAATTAAGSTTGEASSTSAGSTTSSAGGAGPVSSSSATGGPVCGNGIVDPGEECDDANTIADDACTNACLLPICGDGIVQASTGEQCDDANAIEDDGCTTGCAVTGVPLWTVSYDLTGELWAGMAVVPGGVVVVGAQLDASNLLRPLIARYDESGVLQSVVSWTPAIGTGAGALQDVAVAGNGDLLVTGTVTSATDGTDDIYVARLAPTFNVIWETGIQAMGSETAAAVAVPTIANEERLYVAGSVDVGNGADIAVVRLSPTDGTIAYYDIVDGAGEDDFGNGLAVDANGAVYVAGALKNASNYDFWVRRYVDTGTALTASWTQGVGEASDQAAFDVRIDAQGQPVATGWDETLDPNGDVIIRTLAANTGAVTETLRYAGAGDSQDEAYNVAVGPSGELLACGVQRNTSGDLAILATKFDAAGAAKWTSTHDGTGFNGDFDDYGFACAFDSAGNAYVAGRQQTTNGGTDAWLTKYAP